jgi:hypothetical protein
MNWPGDVTGPCVMLVVTSFRGRRPPRPWRRVCLGCYAISSRPSAEDYAIRFQENAARQGRRDRYSVEDSAVVHRVGTMLPAAGGAS